VSLDYAIKIAQANEHYPKWKLGCVIKKGGAVQSVGWSIWKHSPMFVDNHMNCSVHAEAHALRQMGYSARNCTMFVARALKGGGIGMAKPCQYCQELIEDSGIKRVVFTIDEDTTGTWRPQR
jgi:pyrimidine deaminase RibD-like protein